MEKSKEKNRLLFKNVTFCDIENYRKFLEFHNDRNKLKYYLYTLFISILLIFCLIVCFKDKYYILSLLFTLIFIFFISYRVFKPLFKIKKEVKEKKLSKGFKNVFFFYPNYFSVKNHKGRSKIRYYKVHKVYETPEFFYIYIDNENAFLLSREDFKEGTSKKFSKFIRKKVIFRYSNYTKISKYKINIYDITK